MAFLEQFRERTSGSAELRGTVLAKGAVKTTWLLATGQENILKEL